MSLETDDIRSELVHHFRAAADYTGGCTQREREEAHYERGRKDGLGVALELVDTFLSSRNGAPGRRRPAEEIVVAVESGNRFAKYAGRPGEDERARWRGYVERLPYLGV